MTSDRFSSSQPDVTFRPAGVGHASGWRVCEVWVEELRKAATP